MLPNIDALTSHVNMKNALQRRPAAPSTGGIALEIVDDPGAIDAEAWETRFAISAERNDAGSQNQISQRDIRDEPPRGGHQRLPLKSLSETS